MLLGTGPGTRTPNQLIKSKGTENFQSPALDLSVSVDVSKTLKTNKVNPQNQINHFFPKKRDIAHYETMPLKDIYGVKLVAI